MPRMFFIIGRKSIFIIAALFLYSSFVFVINFGFLKKWLQKKLYEFEENEAVYRKFLSIWFNKHCIRPINFSKKHLDNAKNHMQKYYFAKLFLDALHGIYENIGLIIPFILFYSLYQNKHIEMPVLMQLINLWVFFHYAIIKFAEGIEKYICYDVVNIRLKEVQGTVKLPSNFNDMIELRNINIAIDSRKIIDNFSLRIMRGQKINIVADNAHGKTTLMRAMQGIQYFEGKISLPEKIVWIPEQPIFSHNFLDEMKNNEEFKKYCAMLNIDHEIDLAKLSGAEKWKLLAAYSLCFDYIVWDDPFWGLNTKENIQKILQYINDAKLDKTMLIFSAQKINNMQLVYLN